MVNGIEAANGRKPRTSRPHPYGTPLLKLFSSVWFGIALLVLIFVYSSLGSAVPPIRQHRWLEMTEMEWFAWWPFRLLITLLCLNLVIVTVRRIPLRLTRAGAWIVHSGILILCAGSVYYFGSKLEGDTPVFRRHAEIRIPGRDEPLRMLIRPENHVSASGEGGEYRFAVESVLPDWPILSGDDKGKRAYAVRIAVETPTQSFTRQVLAGFPEYTEDILASGQRAKKQTGRALVDDALRIDLAYEPQEHFYLAYSAALYLRSDTAEPWTQRPIIDLPHYHDRVESLDQVWIAPGDEAPEVLPLKAAVADGGSDDPLRGVDVSVTGYLRYAFERSRWVDGGPALNPVVGLRLEGNGGDAAVMDLVAFDPHRNRSRDGRIGFLWVESEPEVDALAAASPAHLSIEVPGDKVSLEVPITDDMLASLDPNVEFRSIEGTEYSFRVRGYMNDQLRSDGRVVSVAIVEIRKPDRTYRRMVADDPAASRDMIEGGESFHKFVEPDPGIRMVYHPSDKPELTVVAGPEPIGVRALVQTGKGNTERYPASIGRPLALDDGRTLTVTQLFAHAQQETRPEIVPLHERDRDARETFSLVRVALSGGDWHKSLWLPFNAYALPNEQYNVPGRIAYDTRWVALPDGRRVELMYSRERMPLPSPVVLDGFELETHAGGYTGSTTSVRDFVSRLRFGTGEAGGWGEPVTVSSNKPQSNGGLWYFQSQWDPPSGSSSGMNYTGLGVGNRKGVYIQLAGAIIAVTGMLFAFYVKPILVRRQRMSLAARAGKDREAVRETAARSQEDWAARDALQEDVDVMEHV